MIDGYMASKIARAEYEERVRSLMYDQQLLGENLPHDYDRWVTRTAGAWHTQLIGSLLLSLRRGIAFLVAKFQHESEIPLEGPLVKQKQSDVSG